MNNSPEKTQLKALMVKKMVQVEDLIKELEDLTRPIAPDVAIGRVSRMDAINNKSVNEAALRQARDKQQGLQHALDNIDKTSFGVCTRCGTEIPMGRILIMPESPKCIRCS